MATELQASLRAEIEELLSDAGSLLAQETLRRGPDSIDGEGGLKELVQRQVAKDADFDLGSRYQSWYSKALPVVRNLLPDRYDEFAEQYRPPQSKDLSVQTYGVAHYLQGLSVSQGGSPLFDPFSVFFTRCTTQIDILRSAAARLDDRLADISGVVQAELLDDELTAARELHRTRHLRAAGALAGVILERHLRTVAETHDIRSRKRHPTIGDFAAALKAAEVIDLPQWRLLQRLADIRNLSVHSGDREPTEDEVSELLDQTDRIIKTLY
jgi:hypothetical protein